MINTIILVFVGGAVGAMSREMLMLAVPPLSDGFPLDILVANLVASFLLGLVTALHQRKVLTDGVNTMLGTGVMGGLSTFSSFAYGSFVLMSASPDRALVSLLYVAVSLLFGFAAVVIGLRLGGSRLHRDGDS